MSKSEIWSPRAVQPIASDRFLLFALKGTDELGLAVSRLLGEPLARHEEREFEDGEHKARPLDNVGGADVYVMHSLHGASSQSANDKLCRLLFFIGACKDAGAARVTAVVPYLCYARKDRRTKSNDPVATRYVAALFEAIGVDAVIALEPHNEAAFENAFRRRAIALSAAPLLIEAIVACVGDERICVISPDLGGGKRADLLRGALETLLKRPIGAAFAEKHRSAGVVSGDLFVGDVAGATCVMIDDLISTGGTLVRAAQAARRAGAKRVIACAAHGLFASGADAILADPTIERIIVTDTASPFRLPAGAARDKLQIVPAAPLLAEGISRAAQGKAFTDLLVY